MAAQNHFKVAVFLAQNITFWGDNFQTSSSRFFDSPKYRWRSIALPAVMSHL